MRVLALTHGATEGPELFGDVVRENGHELVEWEIGTKGRPPADDYDAVMVFGGNMNVGEEDQFPWLDDEYDLIRGWVDDRMPLLGVCLGSQTIAHAFGAKVGPIPEKQAGFTEIELTPAGERDPVLGALPSHFEGLVANGYGFELPDGAVELATAAPSNQAFRIGDRTWAVQFHPEIRRDQVLGWFSKRDSLPRPLPEITEELDAKLPAWQALGRKLCEAFLAAANSR